MEYSVVVPSIGRATLSKSLQSVFEQTISPKEVFVVVPEKFGTSFNCSWDVTFISNPSINHNAASNRNLGIRQVSTPFVALIDDDDYWFPNKMQTQLNVLQENEKTISLTSASVRHRNQRQFQRPKTPLNTDISPLFELYGRRRWLQSPYYLPTPSVVLSTELAKMTPFDESLDYYEDFWWLHSLVANGGRIRQSLDISLLVNTSQARALSRENVQSNLAWADRLVEIDPRLARNFLLGVAMRNAIFRRRWDEVLAYVTGLSEISSGI